MPEFIMPLESTDAVMSFNALDSFTRGYIEAMFFTNTGTGDDDDLEDAHFGELAPETLTAIIADCASFMQANQAALDEAFEITEYDYDDEKAGRDFWFTRNGHGVGFWERGLGDVGVRLTDACGWRSAFPEVDLYRGDDGLLYLA